MNVEEAKLTRELREAELVAIGTSKHAGAKLSDIYHTAIGKFPNQRFSLHTIIAVILLAEFEEGDSSQC